MLASNGLSTPPLRRAALVAFTAAQAPSPIAIPFIDRRFQPQLDKPEHVPVYDASGHRFEEVRMRDRVEIFRQIGVHHVGVAAAEQPVRFLDRIDRAATLTIAMGAILETRLEDRLQHNLGGGLHDPIPDRRDAKRVFAPPPRLRDRHPPHGIGPVRLQDEVFSQTRNPPHYALRLNLFEGHAIHACRARIVAGETVGVAQNIFATNLVVRRK